MTKSRSARLNPSRAPRAPAPRDEVFILDGLKHDGRRFVTSTKTRGGIAAAQARHGLRPSVRVFHWQQHGYGESADIMEGWRLIERFTL